MSEANALAMGNIFYRIYRYRLVTITYVELHKLCHLSVSCSRMFHACWRSVLHDTFFASFLLLFAFSDGTRGKIDTDRAQRRERE